MDQWNRYRRVESSQHPTCPGAYRAWYNRFWGEERGKFLHVSYNSYAHRMAIYAISTEQRTLELDTLADENEWKEYSVVETMDEALKEAIKHSKEGMNVLLSPACASFDQYKNYEERRKSF